MLKQELEDLSVSRELLSEISEQHAKLLSQCLDAILAILEQAAGFSEFDFSQELDNVELGRAIGSKKILGIQTKLLAWALNFFVAKEKAESISAEDFSDRAEKRLDLWQTKAAKAKNQIRTLAKAMGQEEYSRFSHQYRLLYTELSWRLLK